MKRLVKPFDNLRENEIIAQVLFFSEDHRGTYDLCGQTTALDLSSALCTFANTPNPASQLIEAFSLEELKIKRERMIRNMKNSAWVKKFLKPFI